ncbi:MAG: aldo/keto reductase [Planctomycetota bacterium]
MPTALDHYVTLGNSGLRVSPLCLGAMTFGAEWGIGVEEPESFELLEAYLSKGGNFIDTANMYNKGHSEVILGNYFKDRHGVGVNGARFPERDRVVIATKWLGNMFPGDPNGGGSSRKAMIESVDHSLRRMHTDYIDLLWQHFWDRHTPIEETMRGLDDLVTSGKVRYVGFSDTPAWVCAQAQTMAHFRGWSPLIALQIEYSLIERTVEGELMPMAQHMGMGVTPWSPLKGGILSGKYKKDKMPDEGRYGEDSKHFNDTTWAILDALEKVAQDRDCSVPQAALAWVRQRDGVASTIIGARRMAHLEDNLGSLEVDLTKAQMQALDDASEPKLNFPHDFLEFVTDGIQNGTTVNGKPSSAWGASPKDHSERW